jgi:hypothetical protein
MPGNDSRNVESQKILDLLENVTVASFLRTIFEIGYPVVTRKLLLIRQKLPRKKDPTSGLWVQDPTEVLHKAATIIKQKANSLNWVVDDLSGNNATKSNILSALKKKPDFVMYYGHCCGIGCAHICGQENDKSVAAIGLHSGVGGKSNVDLISGITASANACLTASNLGPDAIKKGTLAYLGYTNLLTGISFQFSNENDPVPTAATASPAELTILNAQADFIECVNSYNIALLEGCTYKEAFAIGDDMYKKKWGTWKNACSGNPTDFGKKICPMIKDVFNQNRQIFARLGNPSAVARPIGILVSQG